MDRLPKNPSKVAEIEEQFTEMYKERKTGVKSRRKPLKIDSSSSSDSEEVFGGDVTKRLQEAIEHRDVDANSHQSQGKQQHNQDLELNTEQQLSAQKPVVNQFEYQAAKFARRASLTKVQALTLYSKGQNYTGKKDD